MKGPFCPSRPIFPSERHVFQDLILKLNYKTKNISNCVAVCIWGIKLLLCGAEIYLPPFILCTNLKLWAVVFNSNSNIRCH